MDVKRTGRPPSPNSTAELRECPRHGLVEFHRYGEQSRGGPRWRCKRCVGERVTARHRKMRRILVQEAGGCCAVCGYDKFIGNLHFHHVDPGTKELQMTMASGKALATYREEAKKCVLVCANCHGEIEADLIESPPAEARFRRLRAA